MICLIEYATPQFDEALHLRDVLLRQPLNMVFKTKDIALEYDSFHFGYYDSPGVLKGCLTLLPISSKEVKMRQVAVAPDMQNVGIGRKLVDYSEKWASSQGFELMALHARDSAVGFYEKLGYLKRGAPFTEVGLQHFKMTKSLK